MRYLALGDSYTIGEGVPAPDQWPRQLVRLLAERGVEIRELLMIARTAWTTDELEDAIDAAPPTGTFDLVTLMIGVNDQYRARWVSDFELFFNSVFKRALSFAPSPARLLVISIPDWGASPYADGQDRTRISREIEAFNACERARVLKARAQWVDVTAASLRMAEDRSLAVEDGLHPSGAMYREWAALVLPATLRALGRS